MGCSRCYPRSIHLLLGSGIVKKKSHRQKQPAKLTLQLGHLLGRVWRVLCVLLHCCTSPRLWALLSSHFAEGQTWPKVTPADGAEVPPNLESSFESAYGLMCRVTLSYLSHCCCIQLARTCIFPTWGATSIKVKIRTVSQPSLPTWPPTVDPFCAATVTSCGQSVNCIDWRTRGATCSSIMPSCF